MLLTKLQNKFINNTLIFHYFFPQVLLLVSLTPTEVENEIQGIEDCEREAVT